MASAEVRTEGGKLHPFVAIDRRSAFAVALLLMENARPTACQFLEGLLEVVPCRIHALPTGNGIQFGPRVRGTGAPPSRAGAAST